MKPSLPKTWSKHRASLLRLPSYPEGYPVHVTIGTHQRLTVFNSAAIAQLVFRVLKTHERTLAAVLMPDHVHWILDCTEHMPEAVTDFKSLSTRLAWQEGIRGRLWQRSYFDHVIRDEKSLEETVRYVLANPVRAELVPEVGEYRWAYDRFGIGLPLPTR